MKLYQKIVLRVFSAFKQGSLLFTTPHGEEYVFGAPGSVAEFKRAEQQAKTGKQQRSLTVMQPVRIDVKDQRFFRHVVFYGDVGFGEAYTEGWWQTPDLKAVLLFFIANKQAWPNSSGGARRVPVYSIFNWMTALHHRLKKNTIKQAKRNIEDHYDLSNDFFALILDKTMTYSSALFVKPQLSLAEAQLAKYDRLCKEAQLNKHDHVLEIGSGWGGFAQFAAKHYGCKVTSITISPEQYKYATARIRRARLTQRVNFELIDYRQLHGRFDKIVSIEMIEAVGVHYLQDFFMRCSQLLKPNGILALQAIVCSDFQFSWAKRGTDWIQKHIFPGSFIPSLHAILSTLVRKEMFFLYNLKDLGKDYARTLATWCKRLKANTNALRDLGYNESFIRKWEYYFKYCEAGFDARYLSVVQLTFTRPMQPMHKELALPASRS